MSYELDLFSKCYDHILKNEGVYANDPQDKGGETYIGISRKYHATWEGWSLIDEYKQMNGFPNNAYSDDDLNEMVRDFYKNKFYDRMELDLIVNENSVLQIFDMGVNAGIKTAIKLAQKACDASLIVDGIMGIKTAFEINHWGFKFFDLYVKQRIEHYNGIVERKPSQGKFLNGWINRAKNTKFA